MPDGEKVSFVNSKEDVADAIINCIRIVNQMSSPDRRLQESADAILVGEGGNLDSLGLINLLVSIEDELSTRFELDVALLDDELMTSNNGALRSVETLASWIVENCD